VFIMEDRNEFGGLLVDRVDEVAEAGADVGDRVIAERRIQNP